jgi:hypothetical protein
MMTLPDVIFGRSKWPPGVYIFLGGFYLSSHCQHLYAIGIAETLVKRLGWSNTPPWSQPAQSWDVGEGLITKKLPLAAH